MTLRQTSGDQHGELSEAESDTSSIDVSMRPPSPASREQLLKRMESLVQENRVLKIEVDALKMRVKGLQNENKVLKEASVQIQARAEQEEEFISNTLLKKIQELKKEKEALALNYEQEEECLTNDLSRKLIKLRQEKEELASNLHQEQESLVAKLVKRIKKLEGETNAKQLHLEQLRREKIELENTLEQEQEALVNRLWKRLDSLETEKQSLQKKLDQPVTAPPSPMDINMQQPLFNNAQSSDDSAAPSNNPIALSRDIIRLRSEVTQLKQQLRISQTENVEKMAQFAREEQQIRDENCRLQKRLQLEIDRRNKLMQNLSESESSLDIDDEKLLSNAAAAAGNSSAAYNLPAEFLSCKRKIRSRGEPSPMRVSPLPHQSSANVIRPISPITVQRHSRNAHSTDQGRVSPPIESLSSPRTSFSSSVRCPCCGHSLENEKPKTEESSTDFIRPANPAENHKSNSSQQ